MIHDGEVVLNLMTKEIRRAWSEQKALAHALKAVAHETSDVIKPLRRRRKQT